MLDSVKTVMHHTNSNAKRGGNSLPDFWMGSYPVPDSHMGAIREQQKQVKVVVAIRDIVAVQITTTNIFHFTHFNYCSLHGSHITARLRSSMKVTHITSLVLSPAPLLTLTHAHILKT